MDPVWMPAWHQRWRVVRAARNAVRSAFFGVMESAARTDEARSIVSEMLGDAVRSRAALPASALGHKVPYPELGRAHADILNGLVVPRRPVFITARFRSGSTLLWNLFRHVDGCTAYYEPLNERRWFDAQHRGRRIDRTHRHVDDYWREYEGLEDLGRHYREDWIRRDLHMDEQSWDPSLAAYVRLLVDRAPGRPVLQFNRIDFRLPWFRHVFPEATIVHLYRHPRDQWCSTLVNWADCPPSCTLAEFAEHDGFYLLTWAADLKYRFPFLEPAAAGHPYRLFYLIWKLSFWYGAAYAHHSLSFEDLVARPEIELQRLFRTTAIDDPDITRLAALIEPAPSRWPRYASHEWFSAHEAACEDVLREFFGASGVQRAQKLA